MSHPIPAPTPASADAPASAPGQDPGTPDAGPAGLPVFLSASVPDEIAGTPEAQGVYSLISGIARGLFDLGALLVSGGHPTVTPLLHRLARDRDPPPPVALFQLQRFRAQAPPEAADRAVFGQVHWVGDPAADLEEDLKSLREPMARLARAAVFVGGKTTGFSGGKPGIRDEFERFRAAHPDAPVYLVGAAGGETARLIADADRDPTGTDWEKNGLDGAARHLLHTAGEPGLIAALIARDLRRL